MSEGRVNELCAKTGMMAMMASSAYVKFISRERFRSRPQSANLGDDLRPVETKMIKHMDIKTAAKIMQVKPRKPVDELEHQGIFYRDNDNRRMPKLEYIQKGFFSTMLTDYKRGPYRQIINKALVTSLGMEFLKQFVYQSPSKNALLEKPKTTPTEANKEAEQCSPT